MLLDLIFFYKNLYLTPETIDTNNNTDKKPLIVFDKVKS